MSYVPGNFNLTQQQFEARADGGPNRQQKSKPTLEQSHQARTNSMALTLNQQISRSNSLSGDVKHKEKNSSSKTKDADRKLDLNQIQPQIGGPQKKGTLSTEVDPNFGRQIGTQSLIATVSPMSVKNAKNQNLMQNVSNSNQKQTYVGTSQAMIGQAAQNQIGSKNTKTFKPVIIYKVNNDSSQVQRDQAYRDKRVDNRRAPSHEVQANSEPVTSLPKSDHRTSFPVRRSGYNGNSISNNGGQQSMPNTSNSQVYKVSNVSQNTTILSRNQKHNNPQNKLVGQAFSSGPQLVGQNNQRMFKGSGIMMGADQLNNENNNQNTLLQTSSIVSNHILNGSGTHQNFPEIRKSQHLEQKRQTVGVMDNQSNIIFNPSHRQSNISNISDNIAANYNQNGQNYNGSGQTSTQQKYNDTINGIPAGFNNKLSKSRTNRRNNIDLNIPGGITSHIKNVTTDCISTTVGGRIVIGGGGQTNNLVGQSKNRSGQFSGGKQGKQQNSINQFNRQMYSLDQDMHQQQQQNRSQQPSNMANNSHVGPTLANSGSYNRAMSGNSTKFKNNRMRSVNNNDNAGGGGFKGAASNTHHQTSVHQQSISGNGSIQISQGPKPTTNYAALGQIGGQQQMLKTAHASQNLKQLSLNNQNQLKDKKSSLVLSGANQSSGNGGQAGQTQGRFTYQTQKQYSGKARKMLQEGVDPNTNQFNFKDIADPKGQAQSPTINLPNANPIQSKQRNTNLMPQVNSDFLQKQGQFTVGAARPQMTQKISSGKPQKFAVGPINPTTNYGSRKQVAGGSRGGSQPKNVTASNANADGKMRGSSNSRYSAHSNRSPVSQKSARSGLSNNESNVSGASGHHKKSDKNEDPTYYQKGRRGQTQSNDRHPRSRGKIYDNEPKPLTDHRSSQRKYQNKKQQNHVPSQGKPHNQTTGLQIVNTSMNNNNQIQDIQNTQKNTQQQKTEKNFFSDRPTNSAYSRKVNQGRPSSNKVLKTGDKNEFVTFNKQGRQDNLPSSGQKSSAPAANPKETLGTLQQTSVMGRNRSNQNRNRNQLEKIAVNYGLKKESNLEMQKNPMQAGTYDQFQQKNTSGQNNMILNKYLSNHPQASQNTKTVAHLNKYQQQKIDLNRNDDKVNPDRGQRRIQKQQPAANTTINNLQNSIGQQNNVKIRKTLSQNRESNNDGDLDDEPGQNRNKIRSPQQNQNENGMVKQLNTEPNQLIRQIQPNNQNSKKFNQQTLLKKDLALNLKTTNKDMFKPEEENKSKIKSRNPNVGQPTIGMNSAQKALFNSNKEQLPSASLEYSQQIVEQPPASSNQSAASTQDEGQSAESSDQVSGVADIVQKAISQAAGTGETRNNQQPPSELQNYSSQTDNDQQNRQNQIQRQNHQKSLPDKMGQYNKIIQEVEREGQKQYLNFNNNLNPIQNIIEAQLKGLIQGGNFLIGRSGGGAEDEAVSPQKFMPLKDFEDAKFASKSHGLITSYAANTHQGIQRNYNEDRVSIILNMTRPENKDPATWPKCSFFAIYDGHGGSSCADFLKDHLHTIIISQNCFPSDPKKALLDGCRIAEESFEKIADKGVLFDKSGSCAIIVLTVENECYVANVGDSRAIMSSENGMRVYELSQDHRPNEEQEFYRIQENKGQVYQTQTFQTIPVTDQYGQVTGQQKQMLYGPYRVLPGRLSVSRTFGDIEAKLEKYGGKKGVIIAEPEISQFTIDENVHDFIVLGCDGIYDRLTSVNVLDSAWSAMQHAVKTQKEQQTKKWLSIHQITGKMTDAILRSSAIERSFDNLTIVIISFKSLKTFYEKLMQQKPEKKAEYLNISEQKN